MIDVPIDPAVESLRLLLTIDNLSKGRLTPFCTEDSAFIAPCVRSRRCKRVPS
jgi:hypothetical protein